MAAPHNIALIGYGAVGQIMHAPLIAATGGLTLHSIVSRQSETVAQHHPGVRVVADPEAVFADPAIAAVVIAAPNEVHADLACRALQAGKHVVVDKPFTITLAEAETVLETARTAGRMVTVFQNRRWDADFLTLKALLATGEIGEPLEFHAHYDRFRPEVQVRWRETGAPGSGIWVDLGAHLADQALTLFGPPEAVSADLGRQRPGSPSVDYFHVQLHYPRLRVHLHGSCYASDSAPRYRLHGSRASYAKSGLDVQEAQLRAGLLPGCPDWGVDPDQGILTRLEAGAPVQQTIPNLPGDYRGYYAAVRDALDDRGPMPVNPDEALLTMRLLTLAEDSAATGRRLPFPGIA